LAICFRIITERYTEKNGFVTATKLQTKNKNFVAATQNFAAATKRLVDRTKHFVVVTKYFRYPYFNKWFCWYNKTFFVVIVEEITLLWLLIKTTKNRFEIRWLQAVIMSPKVTEKVILGSGYSVGLIGRIIPERC